MKIAAYCRVSTDKQDQLNSLETQKGFFLSYAEKTGDELVRVYADEGISGTKTKNRAAFLRLMEDARKGLFLAVVVKDISRFARNTVDLLSSTRELKALGVEVRFLTANMTTLGDSEFVLTMFGALAQEESANTSKRIKFSKRVNAEKGRVPNLVFGYDKTPGDYFRLTVNEREAEIVRRIFTLYTKEGLGGHTIAGILNGEGIATKRGCGWTGSAVTRILRNELYAGWVVNGRQEVADFLTGRRRERERADWCVTERPELAIVKGEVFARAQEILTQRQRDFKVHKTRRSGRHLFSAIIRCGDCGYAFRRLERASVTWVCSGRNARGAGSCGNRVILPEEELAGQLNGWFARLLSGREGEILTRAKRLYREAGRREDSGVAREKRLQELRRRRRRYAELYADGLLGPEGRETLGRLRTEIASLESEDAKRPSMREASPDFFDGPVRLVDIRTAGNARLGRVIERIAVGPDGGVHVHLREVGRAVFEN